MMMSRRFGDVWELGSGMVGGGLHVDPESWLVSVHKYTHRFGRTSAMSGNVRCLTNVEAGHESVHAGCHGGHWSRHVVDSAAESRISVL